MSFSHIDRKQAHLSHKHTQFLTLRISVHTSVRSHHITCGEENTAVCLWGFFFLFFFCAFPPRDCSPVLPHPRAHKQNPHSSTSSNTVSWWSGTSTTPFSTEFKEPVPVLSHDQPRIPTALPGPPWGSWRKGLYGKRGLRGKLTDGISDSKTSLFGDPYWIFNLNQFFLKLISNVNNLCLSCSAFHLLTVCIWKTEQQQIWAFIDLGKCPKRTRL